MHDVLNPPRAHGGSAGSGKLRATPEDFVVREWLGFEPDGEGDHWMLTVRKRGANTHWVVKQLARLGKIHPRDVGFAGLKDRDAVTEQAFTVPVRSAIGGDWSGVTGDGFEVLTAVRHRRKLKRGALRGNEFEIVVRQWQGERAVLDQRLAAIARHGVPNYFGPQRFGKDAGNLGIANQWFADGVEPRDRFERSFALSAARSAIFNAVLAVRVTDGSWDQLQIGDVANLNGSGSIFSVADLDDTLRERCRELDIHPTGPMWGGAGTSAQGAVGALEQTVADRYSVLATGLTVAGLESERRALRMQVSALRWSVEDDAVKLQFRLPRGAYATVVLHELLSNAFTQALGENEE
jgi:tRNA pseudouridine13 synthase